MCLCVYVFFSKQGEIFKRYYEARASQFVLLLPTKTTFLYVRPPCKIIIKHNLTYGRLAISSPICQDHWHFLLIWISLSSWSYSRLCLSTSSPKRASPWWWSVATTAGKEVSGSSVRQRNVGSGGILTPLLLLTTARHQGWDGGSSDPSWMYPTIVGMALSSLFPFPRKCLETECPYLHTATYGSLLIPLPPIE